MGERLIAGWASGNTGAGDWAGAGSGSLMTGRLDVGVRSVASTGRAGRAGSSCGDGVVLLPGVEFPRAGSSLSMMLEGGPESPAGGEEKSCDPVSRSCPCISPIHEASATTMKVVVERIRIPKDVDFISRS